MASRTRRFIVSSSDGRRRPWRHPLDVRPDRPRAEERAEVDRRAVPLHRAEPGVEAVRAVELRDLVRGGVGRPLAEDLGRHPLRDLADHPAVAVEQLLARVALDVDEPRRDDQAAGVDRPPGLAAVERAGAARSARSGRRRAPRPPGTRRCPSRRRPAPPGSGRRTPPSAGGRATPAADPSGRRSAGRRSRRPAAPGASTAGRRPRPRWSRKLTRTFGTRVVAGVVLVDVRSRRCRSGRAAAGPTRPASPGGGRRASASIVTGP